MYLIGEDGLEEELTLAGIPFLGGKADRQLKNEEIVLEDGVAVVVIGIDRYINYAKIAKATLYLQRPGVRFILTNDDLTYPTPAGLLPCAGSLSVIFSAACGRLPDVFIGKPQPFMFTCIRAMDSSILPSSTLMIGDRLNTDIAFGNALGISTVLVETGVHTRQDVEKSADKPTFVLPSIGSIFH